MVSLNPDQFKDIYERTKKPGSGATVNVQTGQWPTSGWAVAKVGHERVTPTKEYSQASLEKYAKDESTALNQTGHLGVWHQKGKGVYQDATKVEPDTYKGGITAIAKAQPIVNKKKVTRRGEKSVFNLSTFKTMTMHPESYTEKRETRSARRTLSKQAPQGKIRDMPTKALADAFRDRRPSP